MSVVLDSTVLIDLLRRRRPVLERVRQLRAAGPVPYTTVINVEEVHRGLRSTEMEAVDRLLNGLHILTISRRDAGTAGTWRRDYSARGITLSQADCLIAATAVGNGLPLATGNPKHFPMPEVDLRHWPVGE